MDWNDWIDEVYRTVRRCASADACKILMAVHYGRASEVLRMYEKDFSPQDVANWIMGSLYDDVVGEAVEPPGSEA